ncbi:hypothetical protein EUGRSUZ_G01396 [Eucalyptus grandis]|uniref:Uncharacterized protein n=2 Tax=Eucalyptus grandis TaxID=71139 RepID=A0ACC3K2F0_EUCGR|nr:hypothetical protein EUGRSUZ_G01396 [Eucalyptus grandis]
MIIRERWIELGLGFFFMFSSSSLSLHKQIAVIQSTMLLAPLELQSVVGRVGCHHLFFLRRPQASSPSSRASSSSWRNLVHSLISSVAGVMDLSSGSLANH